DRQSSRQTDAGLPILGGESSERSGGYAASDAFAAPGGYAASGGYAAPPGQPWATPEGPAGSRPAWEVPQDHQPSPTPPPAGGPPTPPGFVAAPGPTVEPDSRLAEPEEFAAPGERPAEQPRRA